MTDAIVQQLEELSGLKVTPVIHGDARSDGLDSLLTALARHFPEHTHVADELTSIWHGDLHDPQVVVHAWLLEWNGSPVGATVFHTSLRRRTVLQHFVGIDAEARSRLPLRWVQYLANAVLEVGIRDCDEAGTTLLATMGENHPEHARAWERFGYITLDIDYLEPFHGRHWRDFGAPTFFPMTAQIRLAPAGLAEPLGVVAQSAVKAFLLDYYLLEPDEPTVKHTLELAANLS